jgi:small subunit ribosomal protein S4
MGIARTRRAARQLVGHRHIVVNGEVVNIASYQVKAGDVVGVREKSKSLEIIVNSVAGSANGFSWVEFNKHQLEGRYLQMPPRDEIPENIKEQLIVELYSK